MKLAAQDIGSLSAALSSSPTGILDFNKQEAENYFSSVIIYFTTALSVCQGVLQNLLTHKEKYDIIAIRVLPEAGVFLACGGGCSPLSTVKGGDN